MTQLQEIDSLSGERKLENGAPDTERDEEPDWHHSVLGIYVRARYT